MSEKNIQELLKDLQQLKQENYALKSLCNNKAAENEKLSERLHSFEWMFIKKQTAATQYVADYGDLSRLNKNGLIKKSIQKDQLQDIVSEYLDLLETSAAIYEKNGDYAMGIFSSGWCQRMDSASRRLCNTDDNRKALASGKWLCHDSCWRDASLKSMNEGKPAEVACNGGLNLYAVPVWANKQIIGAINFGFGSPPKKDAELKKLSTKFKIPLKELRGHSTAYNDRPHFIIDYAKQRIQNSAKYLGYLVELKQAELELAESAERYKSLHNASFGGIAIHDKGIILECNQGLSDMTGYSLDELTGMDGLLLIAPEHREMVMNKIIAGYEKPYEANCLQKNGAQFPIRLEARNVPYKGKNVRTVEFRDITESKQVEIMLREEKDRIRTILDMVGDPIFVKDNDHRITLANRAFYDIFCLDEKSVIGFTLAEAVPENERQHFLEVDRRVLDTGITDIREEELTVRNLTRTIITKKKCFTDESGKRFLVGSIHDITDRKQAEELLRRSEKDLRESQRIAQVGSWRLDVATNQVVWSKELYNMYGFDPSVPPPPYTEHMKLFTAESWERLSTALAHTRETGIPYTLELETVRKDGSNGWMWVRGEVDVDSAGKIVGLWGAAQDITGRKLAEETLRIKNQVFEDSIASQSVSDSAGTITHVNPAFIRLWGYTSKEQAIGNSVGSFFADQADAVPVLEALATHDAWEGEFLAKRTDGTTFISRGFATILRNTRGELIGYQSTNLDVTKEREAEEEIRKLNAELEDRVAIRTSQLEASNKELEAFSYSVSHDLRAPLRHVSGYVELLHKHFQSDLPEKGQHYLNSISDSTRIMGMLIDDLLQFSRSGRTEMHQSDCDMNKVVKETIESLHKDNPDRKIEWVKGKLPTVYGDEAMLRLVWTNLLSNAVKFTRTRKKARIEIGVRKENKELVFFVRDNGVGFDMQYAQKLFGVFQRLHPTEEFEGTGIGLANVQRIVSRHGGRAWAEAEPDKGAVFYFSIPNK